MINQSIVIQPCSPQIGMNEPDYPSGSRIEPASDVLADSNGSTGDQSHLLPQQQHQPMQEPTTQASLARQYKKSSTTSITTSMDTDEELQTSGDHTLRNSKVFLKGYII